MIANRVCQDTVAVPQFGDSLGSRFEYQVGVAEGVVTDNISGFCDLACNVGTLLHKHAQHEKGRMHVMLSENVEQVSYTVRTKADEIADTITEINKTVQQVNVTVQDVNLRTRGQVARVDAMVTDALNTTHEVSHNIQEGIRKPIRKVAGMIEGLKAGLETLAAKSPFAKRPPQSPYDF